MTKASAVERLEQEVARLRERLEELESAGGGSAAGQPVVMQDLMSNTHPSLVLVPRSLLAAEADRLRELLAERDELVNRIRNLRRNRQDRVARANRAYRLAEGQARVFGEQNFGQVDEEEARQEGRRLEREAAELTAQIEAAEQRLEEVLRTVRREWLPVPIVSPHPVPTADEMTIQE